MNEIGIGHNQPDMAETVISVAGDLSAWMMSHPVIEDEDVAREAKVFIDRAKLAIADLEAERTAKVKPLNDQVKAINDSYREPRELLRKVLDELEYRITDFLAKEEAKRIAAAEEARQAAERAELAARSAERIEADTLLAARDHGELDIDVGATIAETDRTIRAAEKAHHRAQITKRDAENVRIGGGIKPRALTYDTLNPLRKTLYVTDLLAAVAAMKDSERIISAVILAANSYKKLFGKYPPGIEVREERKHDN